MNPQMIMMLLQALRGGQGGATGAAAQNAATTPPFTGGPIPGLSGAGSAPASTGSPMGMGTATPTPIPNAPFNPNMLNQVMQKAQSGQQNAVSPAALQMLQGGGQNIPPQLLQLLMGGMGGGNGQ